MYVCMYKEIKIKINNTYVMSPKIEKKIIRLVKTTYAGH